MNNKLTQLAQQGCPPGYLDDEIWDCCYVEAVRQKEDIRNAPLLDQLVFLYNKGYSVERLSELLAAANSQTGNNNE